MLLVLYIENDWIKNHCFNFHTALLLCLLVYINILNILNLLFLARSPLNIFHLILYYFIWKMKYIWLKIGLNEIIFFFEIYLIKKEIITDKTASHAIQRNGIFA